METESENHSYDKEVTCVLKTDNQDSYLALAEKINDNAKISMVLIQHEFGLFRTNETDFIQLLQKKIK